MAFSWQRPLPSARHRRCPAVTRGPALLLLPFALLVCLNSSNAQTAPSSSASPSSASASPPPPSPPPSCPFTGLQPSTPSVSPSRCPAATNLSCCPACSDLNGALQLASANMSVFITGINPDATVNASLGVCKGFEGQQRCLQLLEDLNCATSCNADSGAYISGTSMRVCSAFATTLYEACSPVWMDSVSISELFPNASSLASFAGNVTKLMGSLVTTFAIDDSAACFNGTGVYPAFTACCDPFASLPSCPSTTLDPFKYGSVLNRTIDSNACMGSASAPPPSPPPAAPSSAPAPAAPSSASPPAAPSSAPPPGAVSPAPPSTPPPPVSYPICPFTGNFPSVPSIPPARCPNAASYSCCPACSDLNGALQLASANMSDFVTRISPDATVNASLGVCVGFWGQQRCLQLVEDLNCASSCNPDSGTYISGTTMRVCPVFADLVFSACSPIWMDSVSIPQLFPDSSSLLASFVGNVTKLMGSLVTAYTVDNSSSCFNGTGVYPPYTACCDPLSTPSTCPSTALNPSDYPSDLINRTIDSQSCMGYPPPPPPPPPAPPAPASASAPSTTAPGSSASPSAPSAPSPTAPPSTASPSAPSSSASPSAPAPASTTSPPPPAVTTFPKCPFTNNSPYPTNSIMPRCPAAANLSCCTACQDIDAALKLVRTKLQVVAGRINSSVSVNSDLQICDLFGNLMCEQSVEDILCGLTCNPDAGRYVSVSSGAVSMAVCPNYASFVYSACNTATIGNGPLTTAFPDASSFLSSVVGTIISATTGYSSFNLTVQETSCFNGSPLVPTSVACCDPLTPPYSCPQGALDPSQYLDIIGRPINSSRCPILPPPSPPSAPSSISSFTPPPAAPASSSAPSPPVAPSATPAPPPPSTTSSSSPQAPVTSSNTTTTNQPPPPPKAAAAFPSATAVAVLNTVLILVAAAVL